MKFVDAKKLHDEDEVIVKRPAACSMCWGTSRSTGRMCLSRAMTENCIITLPSNKSVRSRTDIFSVRGLVQNVDLPGIDRDKKV